MDSKFFNYQAAVAASGGSLVVIFHSHLLGSQTKKGRYRYRLPLEIPRSLQLPNFDLDMLNEGFCEEFFRLALSTQLSLSLSVFIL